ncbi:MAG: GNAT family N-acetyltransferase [Deltaproteobacteria bacterium]|nr:GNAT family N-acetyltransferase [Deltaproteobacteria bacterium]
MHPLDNPIWTALTTRQAHLRSEPSLASDARRAARFDPEISVLGGFAEPDFAALASLTAIGERVGLFGDDLRVPASFEVITDVPLVQMVFARDGVAPEAEPDIVALDARDVPAMMALAEVTRPGPFNRRTPELGDFAGIREGGALVAMAGQRLRVPGHIEISAVCTDPAHVGRGYGAALTRWQMRRILAAGERPFLHVRGDNRRAIELYERLGFALRFTSRYVVVQRSA